MALQQRTAQHHFQVAQSLTQCRLGDEFPLGRFANAASFANSYKHLQ
jgi:hypothetical protein